MIDIPRLREAIEALTPKVMAEWPIVVKGQDAMLDVIRDAARLVLAAQSAEGKSDLARIRDRIDSRLNDYLCEMKEGYDDSIKGFNDAWNIVRKVFKEALAAAPTPQPREPDGALPIIDEMDPRYVHLPLTGAHCLDPQPRDPKLKAIRSDEDHAAALARINTLMDAEANTSEGEELDVLTDLVRHYESKSEAGVAVTDAMVCHPAPGGTVTEEMVARGVSAAWTIEPRREVDGKDIRAILEAALTATPLLNDPTPGPCADRCKMARQLGDHDPLRAERKRADECRARWLEEAERATVAEAALSRPAPTREEIASIICSEYEDLDWGDIAPQAKREGVIEPGIHAKCVRAASRILSLMQRGGAR